MPRQWSCWCKIPPISISRIVTKSVEWDKSATNVGVAFSSKQSLQCSLRHERCLDAWLKNPLYAFQHPKANNAINGSNGMRAKRMYGCARCTTLEYLIREACGSMSEIEVRICSHFSWHAERAKHTFWCEQPRIGAPRGARNRSSILWIAHGLGRAKRAVRLRFQPDMVTKRVRHRSSFPSAK